MYNIKLIQLSVASDIVDDMIEAKQIAIIGAIYDIASGKVNFLEDTYVG